MGAHGDAAYRQLLTQVLDALAVDSSQLALWGVSSVMLRLLGELKRCGMGAAVAAVVDHRPSQQGRRIAGQVVLKPQELAAIDFDALIVTIDRDKQVALQTLAAHDQRHPRVLLYGSGHYDFLDPVFEDMVATGFIKSHAGGYPHMLIHLYQSLVYVAQRGLKGHVAEFGVYKGGTTVFLAKVLKHLGHSAVVYGFDTFAGFPQRRNVLDLHDDPTDAFLDYAAVHSYTSQYSNIELIRGDICETYRRLEGIPLILSFFDTDNYSATRMALELCYEQTVAGGVLAFDHFYSPEWPTTIGERIAAHEVLTNKPLLNLHGTGIFLKWEPATNERDAS